MKLYQIIIVDDHQIFRAGLKTMLNETPNFKVIAEAADGEEFLKILENYTPDVILMDIKMPNLNGIGATREALKKYPNLKIIALTMFSEQEYCRDMIDAGAEGFVLKNIEQDELEKAIVRVTEGENYFSQEVMDVICKLEDKNTKKQSIDLKLTQRELEILQLLCKGLSNQEISKELFISPRTVEGHRANLLNKTGSKNTVKLVMYAIKNKLVEI